jgi:hypothetical protein
LLATSPPTIAAITASTPVATNTQTRRITMNRESWRTLGTLRDDSTP